MKPIREEILRNRETGVAETKNKADVARDVQVKLHVVIISSEIKLARRRGPVIASAGFMLRLESLGGQGSLIRRIPLASLASRPS